MRHKKSKLVKLRVTPEEHERLCVLAHHEGGFSALIRKRIFSESVRSPIKADVLLVARIHGSLQQIARTLPDQEKGLNRVEVLVQLKAIDEHLTQLLARLIA